MDIIRIAEKNCKSFVVRNKNFIKTVKYVVIARQYIILWITNDYDWQSETVINFFFELINSYKKFSLACGCSLKLFNPKMKRTKTVTDLLKILCTMCDVSQWSCFSKIIIKSSMVQIFYGRWANSMYGSSNITKNSRSARIFLFHSSTYSRERNKSSLSSKLFFFNTFVWSLLSYQQITQYNYCSVHVTFSPCNLYCL